ncbi:hypothetical protein MD484_g6245, partial [Candolleomyces efflorescens]
MLNSGKPGSNHGGSYVHSSPTDTKDLYRLLEPMADLRSRGGRVGIGLSRMAAASPDATYRAGNAVDAALALADGDDDSTACAIGINLDIWHADALSFIATCVEAEHQNGDIGRVSWILWIPDIL